MLSNDETFYKFRYFTIFSYLFRNATIRSIIYIKSNTIRSKNEENPKRTMQLLYKTFVDNIKITFIVNNNYIDTLKSKSIK